MKTLNTTLIVPLLITLILTGCMPDSLTKFKKDPPKKPVVTTPVGSGPVLDETGVPISFDESTYVSYGNVDNDDLYNEVGSNFTPTIYSDGTLSDSDKKQLFYQKCDLVVSGVNSQASSLPSGMTFNATECRIEGTATAPKSVVTPFCNDAFSTDKVTCESTPLTWNATTQTCSLPDVKYKTQAACLAGVYKWYDVGSPVPYRIKLNYKDAAGFQKNLYTTLTLGVYTKLTSLGYTQSEKVLLKVKSNNSSYLPGIVPLITTSGSTGSYARSNIIINNKNDISGVAKFIDQSLGYIGVTRLVPIKLTTVIPFTVNTFIESVTGTCSLGSSFTAKTTCSTGGGTWTPSKIAKIYKIDTTTRTLFVENISTNNRYFSASELICTGTCGTSYAISSIDTNYLFRKDDRLDNDKQYFLNRFELETPINIFEVGAAINPLVPLATSSIAMTNGITFTISPSLPCEDPTDITKCLYLDSKTGSISGTFSNYLNDTEFTLTASNPISSVSTKLNLSAIYGPTELTLTSKQIITVSNTSNFKEGEILFQPIVPPALPDTALKAKILKVINSKQLAIDSFNGSFEPGASLDNNNSQFQSEKAFIIPYSSCTNTIYTTKALCNTAGEVWSSDQAVHFNIILTTASSPSGYAEGDDISSTSGVGIGALGKVAYVASGARDLLFVQFLTGTAVTTASTPLFHEDDILNTGVSVYQVENGSMKVQLASTAGFVKGSDVVTSGSASGYTSAVSGGYIYLSETSRESSGVFFKKGQTFYNHETQALSTSNSTALNVSFENYFIFERGKKMYLNTLLSNGNGIVYSISPPLPSGLVLNTLTGSISGTATFSTIKKDYVLYATNFIGTTSFVFSLEVKDFFEVIEKTGASSALLHKVGDYQSTRGCRIDASDIASLSNGKALDIRCFLDMEEQDIFQTNIKLNLFTGPSICQYIEYAPYYFNSWMAHTSNGSSSRYQNPHVIRTGCSSYQSSGVVPTTDLCESNYKYYDSDFPNCDEGYLTYQEEVYTENTTTNVCTLASTLTRRVSCGGSRANCIAGPVTDLITKENIELGKRVIIYPTAAGINKENEHKSPISFGDSFINVRTANGSIANRCDSSAANTLSWKNATLATSKLASPMGSDSNPYYTVTCLDAAYDIKARIRVIVRDWDKTFRIDSDIFNQNVTTPAANMNNNNLDPIFSKPYNDVNDWDNSYNGSSPVYASCGTQAAGSCTPILNIFREDFQCTAAGGVVGISDSCTGAYTDEYSCESNGFVWTPATCLFSNQNQCTHYGGTWTGPEYYKFPEDLLGR